ncbi:WD40 repeat domain-containing protein [Algibacillus agarilyticus]|uniref:WD40 repeat domain-containing protein n=1 Tax=Algibacillus agarilyticus TaxID=2234133 RepID=UPI000DCF9F7F|nr:hypothetical protein [Algibacillus agarilyticus]
MKKVLYLICLSLLLSACNKWGENRTARWLHTDNGTYAADLSQNGEYAAVSTADGITLWQVNQHLPKYFWRHDPEKSNEVIHVDIASDNSHVITATENQVALWNMKTGHNKGFWQVEESRIVDIKIANKGRLMLIGLLNGVVELYNLDTGRRVRFLGHNERISRVDLSDNGHFALTGSYDGMALFWDTRSAQVIHSFKHDSRITQVALDQTGQYAFTANSFKDSNIWRLSDGSQQSQLKYPMRQLIFTSAVFSNDANILATGAPNKKIKLWRVKTGELIDEWQYEAEGMGVSILDFAFNEDNSRLISENSFGLAEVWRLQK